MPSRFVGLIHQCVTIAFACVWRAARITFPAFTHTTIYTQAIIDTYILNRRWERARITHTHTHKRWTSKGTEEKSKNKRDYKLHWLVLRLLCVYCNERLSTGSVRLVLQIPFDCRTFLGWMTKTSNRLLLLPSLIRLLPSMLGFVIVVIIPAITASA